MQLKLQRSQREGGVMSKSVIFCLDARVEFNHDEAANLKRYKMLNQVIYTSEDAKKASEGSAAAAAQARGNRYSANSVDDLLFSASAGIGSGLKAAALGALSAMKLRITVDSLQRGQHIECKSLDELLGAEAAVIEACKNLRVYLDTAATFDGREVLIDFSTEEPEIVATATAPSPMLVAPAPASAQPTLLPALGAEATHHRSVHETAGLSPDPHISMGGNGGATAQEFSVEPFVRWWQRLSGGQKVGVVVGAVFILFLLSQCMG